MKQINLQKKIRNKFIKQGVKMIDPNTVYFSEDTKIGKNVTIEPFVVIGSKVKIGNNVKIGGGSGVVKDIKDNQIVMGYPAVPIREFMKNSKK